MTKLEECVCPVAKLVPDNLTGEFICSDCGKMWNICGTIPEVKESGGWGTVELPELRCGTCGERMVRGAGFLCLYGHAATISPCSHLFPAGEDGHEG